MCKRLGKSCISPLKAFVSTRTMGKIMPDDRKKTKTTFNYSSKDSNREELINFIERSIKQFIKFFVLSLEEIA